MNIRCQQLSPIPKPNFLMLIGDRYGWRPPAVAIPDTDFQLIRKAASKDDAAFVASWYRRDDNAVPHRHIIFSIPKLIRRCFLFDRKLLAALSRIAWETLKRDREG